MSKDKEPTRDEMLEYIGNMPLPTLGDARKTYPVVLTEPEINTIHFVVSAFTAMCRAAGKHYNKALAHYGPTAEALSTRLAEFDD